MTRTKKNCFNLARRDNGTKAEEAGGGGVGGGGGWYRRKLYAVIGLNCEYRKERKTL